MIDVFKSLSCIDRSVLVAAGDLSMIALFSIDTCVGSQPYFYTFIGVEITQVQVKFLFEFLRDCHLAS